MPRTLILLVAAALAGGRSAQADPSISNSAEMEELRAWGRQLKAEDPDTARLLVRQCMSEGSLFTDEGKLSVARCMRHKYDEGLRA